MKFRLEDFGLATLAQLWRQFWLESAFWTSQLEKMKKFKQKILFFLVYNL